jgi:molybdate transport system substrate-binding protein
LTRPSTVVALAVVVLVALLGCHSSASSPPPLVFAAVSTSEALGEIGQQFEAEQRVHLQFSFGASRDLARQIRSGAPADILVSADAETVDALERDGLVQHEDRHRFASNQLVVIVPADDSNGRPTLRSADDLKSVPRLAIGDPATVPAGSYAMAWLRKVGVWESVQDRIIPSLDVRAAMAAVEAGRAEAGIVYRTDAAVSKRVRVAFEVPAESGPAISYVSARLRSSTSAPARDFFDYLSGPAARAVLSRHGFTPVDHP